MRELIARVVARLIVAAVSTAAQTALHTNGVEGRRKIRRERERERRDGSGGWGAISELGVSVVQSE